jgi:hypothetical protein
MRKVYAYEPAQSRSHAPESVPRVERSTLTMRQKSAAGIVCAEQRIVQEG